MTNLEVIVIRIIVYGKNNWENSKQIATSIMIFLNSKTELFSNKSEIYKATFQ
jgi:hypothetical protein